MCVCIVAFELQNGALLDSLAPRRSELLRLGTHMHIFTENNDSDADTYDSDADAAAYGGDEL